MKDPNYKLKMVVFSFLMMYGMSFLVIFSKYFL